jgi:hypothetical protein
MSESAQFPQINVVLASKPSSSSSAQTERTMNPASPSFNGVEFQERHSVRHVSLT